MKSVREPKLPPPDPEPEGPQPPGPMPDFPDPDEPDLIDPSPGLEPQTAHDAACRDGLSRQRARSVLCA
jgi:hypothetical protein